MPHNIRISKGHTVRRHRVAKGAALIKHMHLNQSETYGDDVALNSLRHALKGIKIGKPKHYINL